ncbi:ctr copper transporter [Poronia punctata]|nr:ctr copper transporter [Poronia punctata]
MSSDDSMSMGGDSGGMDMGNGMDMGGAACQTFMLWNWNTINSCFLAGSWHIKNEAMMAGTCIGVFLLVVSLEFVRRAGREYDAFIIRRFRGRLNGDVGIFRASPLEQLVRSFLHAVAFGIAYILMLIAMSYNGYVIIMIIIGAGFGKFVADWAPKKVVGRDTSVIQAKNLDCTEEPTMCCG